MNSTLLPARPENIASDCSSRVPISHTGYAYPDTLLSMNSTLLPARPENITSECSSRVPISHTGYAYPDTSLSMNSTLLPARPENITTPHFMTSLALRHRYLTATHCRSTLSFMPSACRSYCTVRDRASAADYCIVRNNGLVLDHITGKAGRLHPCVAVTPGSGPLRLDTLGVVSHG
ncbi:hypothetical protein J6590_000698 [Homalodisca vitripennis]|nr:hypothetical protein J6590_000698 [Homalodisca vitripennis]